MKMKFKYLIILLLGLSIFSCGPKKGIVTKKKNQSPRKEVVIDEPKTVETKKEVEPETTVIKSTENKSVVEVYIDLYAEIAKNKMRTHHIPASITLAQGILESGSGRGRLAVQANNHFGIKCHGWQGAKIYHDDDRSQECFRKYQKAESSFEDHSEFLTGRKRYADLFKLKPDDYKGWARGLRAAGYATDRKYPQKLISLIERYQLFKYDQEVIGNVKITDLNVKPNKKVVHTVTKGDTLYSISRYYNTTVEAIKAKNKLKSDNLSIGQELIIQN